MKIITIFLLTILFNLNVVYAQTTNWRSIEDSQKSLVYLNLGYDFGLTTKLGYAHKLDAFRPILLMADYSFPMGKTLFDDFKFRLGGQIEIFDKNHFSFSAQYFAIVRRQQTNLVRQLGVGSEVMVALGYYKPKWHLAIELGYDKSLATHLKHSDKMTSNFPEIKDGWFYNTGGQLFYGLQGSKTLGENMEISLKIGATNARGKDENALLPYYAQLGITYRVKSKSSK